MPSSIRNWRLFGRLNLLDVALLLIILAVTARYSYTYAQSHWLGQRRPIAVTFAVKAVIPVVAEALKTGDRIYDSKTGTELGTIESVTTQPTMVTGLTSDYPSTERVDIYVELSGPGRITPDEVWLSGEIVRVGQAFELETKSWAGKAYPVQLNLAP